MRFSCKFPKPVLFQGLAVVLAALAYVGIEEWKGGKKIETDNIPEPVANNAVALAEKNGVPHLYSFSGLGAGKTWQDVHSYAYALNLKDGKWLSLDPVPGATGRLASMAVTVNNIIYLFGGYSVGEDGTEVSTPQVYAFDPDTETYSEKAKMLTPVDDSVGLNYNHRYVYLVSGWHDVGNVNSVQVYDTHSDTWFAATDYPGAPVFGHAGGIVENTIVIADGVAVMGEDDNGRRIFGITDQAWAGVIDEHNPATIDWQKLEPHPGTPLYRMAAMGSHQRDQIIFAGGSDNPYNYNGLGYNGQPSEPTDRVFAWDLASGYWIEYDAKGLATMDHRGLIEFESYYYILGGMTGGQTVSDLVTWFELP